LIGPLLILATNAPPTPTENAEFCERTRESANVLVTKAEREAARIRNFWDVFILNREWDESDFIEVTSL